MKKSEEASVKIDKKIPFPPRKYGAKSIYPWKEMGVGDSFVYDGPVANAHSAATYYNRITGNEFSARAHNGHTRVWRIK